MVFIKVVTTDEIRPGEMKAFNIEGKDILLAGYEGSYYAIDNKCTHMGGDLSKGRLEGKIIICPRHKSRFDITTGRCIAGPKIGFLKLKTKDEAAYKVRLEGSNIEVEV
jgi:nitrite reductase/ring-hydroxylating ferredoxin subunit